MMALPQLVVFAYEHGTIEYTHPGWQVLLVACYTPLLLWAPPLASVTRAYYRRRCRD
jgi:hypothetical protein